MPPNEPEQSSGTVGPYQLILFGGLAVRPAGEGRDALGGLPAAIIAWLHVEGRAVPRETLAAVFWPQSGRAQRLHALRQALLLIRKGAPGLLAPASDPVAIERGALSSDLDRLGWALDAGEAEEVLAGWKGPFMETFRRPASWEFEDWVDRQRSDLDRRLSACIGEAVRRAEARGDFFAALDLARRAARILPEDPGIEALIRVLSSRGPLAPPSPAEHPPPPPPGPGPPAPAPVLPVPAPIPLPRRTVPGEARPQAGWGRAWAGIAIGAGLLASAAWGWQSQGDRREWAALLAAPESVLYCSDHASPQGDFHLFRMRLDGTGKHRISDLDGLCRVVWFENPGMLVGHWPGAGGPGRFVRLVPDPSNPIAEWIPTELGSIPPARRIWLSNPQRTGPPWRDRWLLLNAEDSTGNVDLWGLDVLADSLARLTDHPAEDHLPVFDPSGSRILFESGRSGDGDIFELLLEEPGMPVRPVTDHPLHERSPLIRGDSLVIVRGRGEGAEDGGMEIILVDRKTGLERAITENRWNDQNPDWSPDGRHLCWTDERAGHFESVVQVMDLHSGRLRTLDGGPGRTFLCHFTPDGRGVLVQQEGDRPQHILLFSVTGSRALDLSRSPSRSSWIGILPIPPA